MCGVALIRICLSLLRLCTPFNAYWPVVPLQWAAISNGCPSMLLTGRLSVVCIYVCVVSHVRLFAIAWTHHTPLSIRFSRQEYWNGLPFPPPGVLPNPGIEPVSPVSSALVGRFFTTEPPGKPFIYRFYKSHLYNNLYSYTDGKYLLLVCCLFFKSLPNSVFCHVKI